MINWETLKLDILLEYLKDACFGERASAELARRAVAALELLDNCCGHEWEETVYDTRRTLRGYI